MGLRSGKKERHGRAPEGWFAPNLECVRIVVLRIVVKEFFEHGIQGEGSFPGRVGP